MSFQHNAFQHDAFQTFGDPPGQGGDPGPLPSIGLILGAAAGTWKTTLGLAKASVSTVLGLARASIKTFDGLTN